MPGIAGIISKEKFSRLRNDITRMTDVMMHEPFYTSGSYINAALGIAVGWTCRQGSFSDCMPVVNENKDRILIFAGENFTDAGSSSRVEMNGRVFDRHNAGYLMQWYEQDPDAFFLRLNGWFCGVLIDLRGNTITLFNDRYGMQRLYYYETGDAFFFSSEAKSLLKIRPELRRVDPPALAELFSCGCVLENKTLFPGVRVLPGGSRWTFRNGPRAAKAVYFTPAVWEGQPLLGHREFYEKLKERFRTIVPRYFQAGSPVAMSLTGGLDTRMVMAWKEPSCRVPCYTFGSMYRDTFDVRVSRRVAAACDLPHETLRVDQHFLARFRSYAERTVYITDGTLGVGSSPELYLNSRARHIAPVRMTGDFGSEVLRSVRSFKASCPAESLLAPDFNRQVQTAVQSFPGLSGGHPLSFSLFKQLPWNDYGFLAIQQSQLTLRTPFMDNDLVGLVYRAPREARLSDAVSRMLIADGSPQLAGIRTDRGAGGGPALVFLPAMLYREFLFKMEYALNYSLPSWLGGLDRLLTRLKWERLFLGWHKFHHFRTWYRNELAVYLKETLLDDRARNRPYLNRKFIETMINDHIQGIRNYTSEINKVLTAELVHRLLIEQP